MKSRESLRLEGDKLLQRWECGPRLLPGRSCAGSKKPLGSLPWAGPAPSRGAAHPPPSRHGANLERSPVSLAAPGDRDLPCLCRFQQADAPHPNQRPGTWLAVGHPYPVYCSQHAINI